MKVVDNVNDDIKEKGLSADEVYDCATWMCRPPTSSTPHESGNKTKEKKLQTNG